MPKSYQNYKVKCSKSNFLLCHVHPLHLIREGSNLISNYILASSSTIDVECHCSSRLYCSPGGGGSSSIQTTAIEAGIGRNRGLWFSAKSEEKRDIGH